MVPLLPIGDGQAESFTRWSSRRDAIVGTGDPRAFGARAVDLPLSTDDEPSTNSQAAMDAIAAGIASPRCSEIHGCGPDQLFAKFEGTFHRIDVRFDDEASYNSWVKEQVDTAEAVISWNDITERRRGIFQRADGSSMTVVLPPFAPFQAFSIRKQTVGDWTLEQLVAGGSMSNQMVSYLRAVVAARGNILIVGEMGAGKAQSLDSKVLTPTGWTRMGDISVGDQVIGRDGEPHRVLGVYPQGERQSYRVTMSDGGTTECCDEHLWATLSPLHKFRGKEATVRPLSEIRERLRDGAGNRQHFLPLCEPVQFAPQDAPLPLDPYLLGLLLGDGGLTSRTPVLTTADPEIVETLAAILPEGVVPKLSGKYDYRLSGGVRGRPNPLTVALRELGLMGKYSHEKHVPDAYLFASVASRTALLQGLLDTDGSPTGRGGIDFSVSSPDLAEAVVFLIRSLGGTARLRPRTTTHRMAYRVTGRVPNEIPAFRLSRKLRNDPDYVKYGPCRAIDKVEPCGVKQMVCISIDSPDQLYVTDDFIVTHNTSMINMLSHEFAPNERIAVIEEIPEIQIAQPQVVYLTYQPMQATLGLKEVLDSSLYMRFDRVIVGEVHLEGITKMLEVWMTGSDGSFSTYHSDSCERAVERMKLALQLENPNMTAETALGLIRQAVDVVVVLDRVGGLHRCTEIVEIDWRESGGPGKVGQNRIFALDRKADRHLAAGKPDEKGKVMVKAAKYGIPFSADWFAAPLGEGFGSLPRR